MRACHFCMIALACFAGCNGNPELDEFDSFVRASQDGPPRPFASLSQLTERGDRMLWRESEAPFTGTLVTYDSTGLRSKIYYAGQALERWYRAPPSSSIQIHRLAGETARDAIRHYIARNGPGHNEYSFLASHGRESDLPMLLASLRSFPEHKDGSMICSQSHCVAALRAITGANPGNHYSDWASWWKRKYDTEVPDWKPLNE